MIWKFVNPPVGGFDFGVGYGVPRRGFAPPRNDGARNLAPPVGELSAQLTERAVPMIIFP